jgi:hypothetical protein
VNREYAVEVPDDILTADPDRWRWIWWAGTASTRWRSIVIRSFPPERNGLVACYVASRLTGQESVSCTGDVQTVIAMLI